MRKKNKKLMITLLSCLAPWGISNKIGAPIPVNTRKMYTCTIRRIQYTSEYIPTIHLVEPLNNTMSVSLSVVC